MSTIGEIATWAYEMIARPDQVGKAVDSAVDVYRLYCSCIPFDSLRAKTSLTSTVAGTNEYALSGLTGGPYDIAGIISIRINFTSTSGRRLTRRNARLYDSYSNAPRQKPASYARFGGNLIFHPTPDSSNYTFYLRYWKRPAINPPATIGDTTLLTPVEWDELLKWETLYRLYSKLEQHDKAMMLVSPSPIPRYPSTKKLIHHEVGIIPRLLNDLLKTVDMREGIDENFTVNPITRRYTFG